MGFSGFEGNPHVMFQGDDDEEDEDDDELMEQSLFLVPDAFEEDDQIWEDFCKHADDPETVYVPQDLDDTAVLLKKKLLLSLPTMDRYAAS